MVSLEFPLNVSKITNKFYNKFETEVRKIRQVIVGVMK